MPERASGVRVPEEGHARLGELDPDSVIERATNFVVEAGASADRDIDLLERVLHAVDDLVAMLRQVHHDLLVIDVLDDFDLPLLPAALRGARPVVRLKDSQELGILGH